MIDLTSTPSRASSPAVMAGAGGGRLQERMRQAAAKGPTPAAAARPVPRPTTPAATHTAQPAGTTSGSQDAVAIVTKLEETIPDLSSNGFPCFVDLVKEEEFVPSLADPAISPSSRARSKTPSVRAPSTSRGTPGPSNVRRNQTPRPNLTARTPTPAPPIILQAARRLHRDTTPYRRPSHRFASVPAAAAHPGWQELGSGAVCGVGGRSQRARDEDVEMVDETRERSLVPAERVTAVSGAVRASSATRAGVNAVQDISESSDEDEDEVTILGSQRAPITAAERRAARTSRRADEQMPPPPPPTGAGPSLQQHRVEQYVFPSSPLSLFHHFPSHSDRRDRLTRFSDPHIPNHSSPVYDIQHRRYHQLEQPATPHHRRNCMESRVRDHIHLHSYTQHERQDVLRDRQGHPQILSSRSSSTGILNQTPTSSNPNPSNKAETRRERLRSRTRCDCQQKTTTERGLEKETTANVARSVGRNTKRCVSL